jgi:hypothetical protein
MATKDYSTLLGLDDLEWNSAWNSQDQEVNNLANLVKGSSSVPWYP